MFDTLHVLNALRKITTSLDFVLMHYDEFINSWALYSRPAFKAQRNTMLVIVDVTITCISITLVYNNMAHHVQFITTIIRLTN